MLTYIYAPNVQTCTGKNTRENQPKNEVVMICWGKLPGRRSRNRQGTLTQCEQIEQRKRDLVRSSFIASRTSHLGQGGSLEL